MDSPHLNMYCRRSSNIICMDYDFLWNINSDSLRNLHQKMDKKSYIKLPTILVLNKYIFDVSIYLPP